MYLYIYVEDVCGVHIDSGEPFQPDIHTVHTVHVHYILPGERK